MTTTILGFCVLLFLLFAAGVFATRCVRTYRARHMYPREELRYVTFAETMAVNAYYCVLALLCFGVFLFLLVPEMQ